LKIGWVVQVPAGVAYDHTARQWEQDAGTLRAVVANLRSRYGAVRTFLGPARKG